ncbi:MAG: serine/threonine-protein kinase [Deltaproteobacteria bacterium]|nr:serine/threonine-protein kinase [Deltaproteobacteria bacterium]
MNSEPANKKLFNDLYEVHGIIGRGDSSVVYKAVDVYNGNREVALKLLVTDPDKTDFLNLKERLRSEALCMISTNNKFVVKLIDFQVTGEHCYLVTEFAPNLDLKFYLESQSRNLKLDEAKIFLRQILIALEHIHGLGIIHRDIRPENILVFGPQLAKLGDFSNSITVGTQLKDDEVLKAPGSLLYLPPEALRGSQPSPKWDLYSLGVTFLELIRGANPFENVPLIRSLEAREELSKDTLDDVPIELRYVLRLLLQFDQLFRPRSAKEALSYVDNVELAESKCQNLSEIQKNNEEDFEGSNKTVVLSAEELQERLKDAKSSSGRYFVHFRRDLSHLIAKGRDFARNSGGQRLFILALVLALIAGIVFASVGLFSSTADEKEKIEYTRITFFDLPDGIYQSEILKVSPMFEKVLAVIVKKNGKLTLSVIGDYPYVSSASLGQESVIIPVFLQSIRISDPQKAGNNYIFSAINLENNLTGVVKMKFLRAL